ncbi:MAG: alpha/beta hydrolase [Patescibacteria group bacterium]
MGRRRIIIIHGWGAGPSSNWFPWLKREAEAKGFEIQIPSMPNTQTPQLEEWLPHLQQVVGKPDETTVLIGHSLGVITILKYLETLGEGEKIGKAILVSGFGEDLGRVELKSFVNRPLDFDRIRSKADSFVVFHGDNDNLVPLEQAYKLEKALNAKLIVIPGGKHLNAGVGMSEFPQVLAEI